MVALGSDFAGSSTSPAVTPRSSTPWKANITICSASTMPSMPVGKRPPCAQRFETFATSACSPEPKIRKSGPAMSSATIATILMSANQNSISPKIFTEIRFTARTTARAISASTHCGMSVNALQ